MCHRSLLARGHLELRPEERGGVSKEESGNTCGGRDNPGLADTTVPCWLGPKRASRI